MRECNQWLYIFVYSSTWGAAVLFKKLCCSLPAGLVQISRLKSLILSNNTLPYISHIVPTDAYKVSLTDSGFLRSPDKDLLIVCESWLLYDQCGMSMYKAVNSCDGVETLVNTENSDTVMLSLSVGLYTCMVWLWWWQQGVAQYTWSNKYRALCLGHSLFCPFLLF